MSEQLFSDRPHVELLQWLARGSLKQNLLRAIRLWVWLSSLYGDDKDRLLLNEPFTFADWRDGFFNSTHPKGEAIPNLHDPACACARTTAEWIFDAKSGVPASEWRQSLQQHDAIPNMVLDELLQRRLFGVTRRSLHADVQILTELGWLKHQAQKYHRVRDFPTRPVAVSSEPSDTRLNAYDLALVNPDLETIARNLSQPIGGMQRFFLEVDYIISQTNQDRVEDCQDKLRHFWEQTPIPPVKLTYNSAKQGRAIECIVYPVCIYYMQRAVYLCAFGQTPQTKVDWNNYRLDRIQQMTHLEWKDQGIPQLLLELYPQNLPNPDYIQQQMAKAWGFDFYLPRKLMLLRFDREFHERYIKGTFRHETFKRVKYQQAEQLIRQHTPQHQQQQRLLTVLKSRPPQDAYYQVYYREEDTNVGMRLRAWRPKGEVLLPWELRQSIAKEAEAEFQLYQ
jgi:CRISPR-associated protein (TIGR03985 family)